MKTQFKRGDLVKFTFHDPCTHNCGQDRWRNLLGIVVGKAPRKRSGDNPDCWDIFLCGEVMVWNKAYFEKI